jgi:hypothetical protein
MTNSLSTQSLSLEDRFGLRVAARLDVATAELSHDVTERLRAARVRAVDSARRTLAQPVSAIAVSGGAASVTFGGEGQSWWNRIASALPLVALVAGLFLIHTVQNERRASEVAEVDAALLIDDLPPSAYADPGFVQFLKSSRD